MASSAVGSSLSLPYVQRGCVDIYSCCVTLLTTLHAQDFPLILVVILVTGYCIHLRHIEDWI